MLFLRQVCSFRAVDGSLEIVLPVARLKELAPMLHTHGFCTRQQATTKLSKLVRQHPELQDTCGNVHLEICRYALLDLGVGVSDADWAEMQARLKQWHTERAS
eukprot:10609944-Alexandrium_andersonii.AAC.1